MLLSEQEQYPQTLQLRNVASPSSNSTDTNCPEHLGSCIWGDICPYDTAAITQRNSSQCILIEIVRRCSQADDCQWPNSRESPVFMHVIASPTSFGQKLGEY